MIHAHDKVTDPAASTMGTDLPFENISAEGLPEPGVRLTRSLQRAPLGRFTVKADDAPPGSTLVRISGTDGQTTSTRYRRRPEETGPLGPAGGIGPGGIDTVTGRFIPGVRNNAQLQDLERVHEISANAGPYPSFDAHQAQSNRLADRVVHRQRDDEIVRSINHRANIDFATRRP